MRDLATTRITALQMTYDSCNTGKAEVSGFH